MLLPGTHSKWVEISGGSITGFRTAMTGELYALLHDHSTLLKTDRTGRDADSESVDDRASGFGAGVERAIEMPTLDGAACAIAGLQLLHAHLQPP
jgi:2-dehydro-3-deoxygalactonokinase